MNQPAEFPGLQITISGDYVTPIHAVPELTRALVRQAEKFTAQQLQLDQVLELASRRPPVSEVRTALVEEICARIQQMDDALMAQQNYMLDSNDCIALIRGTWNGPQITPPAAPAPIKIGDKLWYAGNQRMGGHWVTIEKVGRKWYTVSGAAWRSRRVYRDTLNADGGEFGSPGKCYRTREEATAISDRAKAWDKLCSLIRTVYHAPKHLTTQQIEHAARILNGKTS